MKVLMVTPTYPPTKCGMADYTELLCKNLSKSHEVYVLTTKIAHIFPGNVAGIMNNWSVFEYGKVRKFVGKIKPDVIHIQYHERDFPGKILAGFLPYLFGRRIKVVTSLAFVDFGNPVSCFLAKMIVKYSSHLTVTTDQDYITVTEKFREYKDKVHKVFDGPNILYNGNTVDRNNIRKKLGITDTETLLLNFGFLKGDKGIEEIIHAARKLLDRGGKIKVLFIAGGHHDKASENYRNKLEKLIKELKLENYVIWLGYVEKGKVSEYIKSCDIGVMPFRDGISGMRSSYWSLLAHGIPTVTTSGRFIPSGLENKKNTILILPEDDEELANAVSLFISNEHLRKDIGEAGKNLVDEKYGWERITREVEEIYGYN
ncbi:MAG: glycosyltransferase family 4 protein [Elusimicrobia bacterium]|nr:glycosyltransferase family 4 protein [Elusimicrobiota bacterium]